MLDDRFQISDVRFRMLDFRCRISDARGLLARSLATAGPLASRGRRGITLLEVLISIGVIAVGLLGVAALIPIGSFAVNETAKSDRSAALGRSAQHEVRVRKMLERMRDDGAARWYFAESGLAFDNSPLGKNIRSQFLIGQPFAIDPLFATEAAADSGTIGYFDCLPFKTTAFSHDDPNLARLRLDIFEGTLGMQNYFTSTPIQRQTRSQQQLPVINRIFTWRDDLIFDLDEDNPDNRPRQSCLRSDGLVAPYEPPVVGGPNSLHAQAADNYTWMLTAVPDPSELPITDPATMTQPKRLDVLTNHRQKTYEVSIVTFYKRDFSCDNTAGPPSERLVGIDFIGTGIGGGDVRLTVPSSGSGAMSLEQAQEHLKAKENEWIMVTGFVREPRLDPIAMAHPPPGGGPIHRRIAKWYRVIRVDDEVEPYHNPVSGLQTHWQRNITLAGPDWDDSVVIPGSPHATIIDGVTGVYTTTVTLE